MSAVTIDEFVQITRAQLPLVEMLGFDVEELDSDKCVVRANYTEDYLRPGGTISGPIMMALADYAMYGAIMGRSGHAQMALTTNLHINFLLRPEPGDVMAEAKVLKLGKRLAVGTVDLFGNVANDLVAHVTCTYSLPVTSIAKMEQPS